MDFHELIAKIGKTLDSFRISYAVTGGYAVSVWGRPRATFDIDVVIELFPPEIESIRIALQKISKIAYIDEGAMREAVERESEFNFIYPEANIKVDFFIAGKDPAAKRELNRRIPLIIANQKVYFVSPEDLILAKLKWFTKTQSTRQLEDIESILKIRGKKLDFRYIRRWSKIEETENIFEPLNKKVKLSSS